MKAVSWFSAGVMSLRRFFQVIYASAFLLLLAPSQFQASNEAQDPIVMLPPQAVARGPLAAPEAYRATIDQEARAAGIPADILTRVLHAESNFRPDIESWNQNGTVDRGIAQLNSAYLEEFAWKYNGGTGIDPYDPGTSIRVAARHLARLHRSFPSWRDTVAAYNCGFSKVKAGKIPKTTQKYIERIFS